MRCVLVVSKIKRTLLSMGVEGSVGMEYIPLCCGNSRIYDTFRDFTYQDG